MADTKPKKQADTKSTEKKSKETSIVSDNDKVVLTLPWEEVKVAYQKAITKLSTRVKTAGFRKGKVPPKIAEAHIGRERLVEEAINLLIPDKYREAIKKGDFKPLTQPEFRPLKLDWEQDWEIEAQFAQRPEFKLGNYKKAVTNALKEFDKALEKKKKEAKDDTSKDEKAKQSDEAIKEQERQDRLQEAFKALIVEIKPTIPELLVKEQTQSELQRLSDQLKQVGATLEDFLKRRQQSFEQLGQELAAQALGQLQLEFILEKIAEEEKLEVSDAEIKKEYQSIMKNAHKHHDHDGHDHDHDHTEEEKGDKPIPEQIKGYLRTKVQRDKLFDFLLKQ